MEPFLYEPLEPKNSLKKDSTCTNENTRMFASLANGGLQLVEDSGVELNGYLDELVTSFVKADTKK